MSTTPIIERAIERQFHLSRLDTLHRAIVAARGMLLMARQALKDTLAGELAKGREVHHG